MSMSLRRTLPAFLLIAAFGCGPVDGPKDAETDDSLVAGADEVKAPWVARHGLSSAAYQSNFDYWTRRGYRLTYVSGHDYRGSARYTAIFKRLPGIAWSSRHGMTAAQYQSYFNSQTAAGYRLVLVEGYAVGSSARYAAIFHRTDGPAWSARHGMTSSQYQAEVSRRTRLGYRLVHVSGYSDGGQARYAAIFQRTGGPRWIARHGMSSSSYQSKVTQYARSGYRVELVSGYYVGNTAYFAAIWHKTSSPRWTARHNLTSGSYQDTVEDLRYAGYHPVLASSYSNGRTVRYATVWHNTTWRSSDLDHIDDTVLAAMTASGIQGLSLAIARRGKLVFAKGYGKADDSGAMHTDNRFRIASVSKPITSIAIMKLIETGRLDMSDKVFGRGAVLGELYAAERNLGRWVDDITIQNLLEHTAGGWSNQSNDPMFMNKSYDHAELIKWVIEDVPLTNRPGTKYAYSNFGYCVLGRVIERVTGKSYLQFVRETVLWPSRAYGMTIGGDRLSDRKSDEVKYFYTNSSSPYNMKVARMDSHGGWIASPIDLVRVGVRVDGFSSKADILAPATIDLMTTKSNVSSYAKGWSVNNADNWWHNGSLPGTKSIFVRTSGEYVWAAVVNESHSSSSSLSNINLDGLMWDVVNGVDSWPSHDLF